MEDRATFENALSQYQTTYIQVGLDQQPPTALDEVRTKILDSLARLEDLVNSESSEIRDFPTNAVKTRDTTRALVSQSTDLRTERKTAQEELHRIGQVLGDPLPAANWTPIYTRIGVIGGLLVTIALIRASQVVV